MKTMMKSIVVKLLAGAGSTFLVIMGTVVPMAGCSAQNTAETSVIADENGFETDGIDEAETVDETGTVISDADSGLYESGDAAAEDSEGAGMPGETAEAADGAVGRTDGAAGDTPESRTDSAGKESTENTGASGSTAKADTGTSDSIVKTGMDTTSDSTAKTDTSAGTGTSDDATAEQKVYQCYGCDFITLDKAVMSKHVSDNGHITCMVSNMPSEALKQKAAAADAARQQTAEKEAEQTEEEAARQAAAEEAARQAAAEKAAAEKAAAEEAARQAAAEQAEAEEAARQAAAEQAAAEEAARQAAAEKAAAEEAARQAAAEKEAAEKAADEQGKFEWYCDRCGQTFVVNNAECKQHAQAHLAEEGKTVYYNCSCGYGTDDFDALTRHIVDANIQGEPFIDGIGESRTVHSYSTVIR